MTRLAASNVIRTQKVKKIKRRALHIIIFIRNRSYVILRGKKRHAH